MPIIFPDSLFEIEKWKAFKGSYPLGSDVGHRIIIVCKHGGTLSYLYVTSQVKKARILARDDIKSLVQIDSTDWDVLTKESCIQCNKDNLSQISEAEFRKDYVAGKVEVLGEIPEKVKKSIISAICSSKSFTDTEKGKYTV